jgi:transposase-like protein
MQRIIAAIEMGATNAIAAEAGGISQRTLYRWLSKGEQDKTNSRFKRFLKAFRTAESKSALSALAVIREECAKGNWKSAAWLLERKHNYKRTTIHEHSSEMESADAKKSLDVHELLVKQSTDLQNAIAKSAKSESWQAYAALQRQLLQVTLQIRSLEAEQGENRFAELTDTQILGEISNMILCLPPVLQQELVSEILENTNIRLLRR